MELGFQGGIKIIRLQPNITPFVNPTSITELLVWHDTSDVGTMTLDGLNRLSAITDKSGNNLTTTQGTLTRQPIYTDLGGGLFGLNFATNKVLVSATDTRFNLQNYTFGAVFRFNGSSGYLFGDSGGSNFMNIGFSSSPVRSRTARYRTDLNATVTTLAENPGVISNATLVYVDYAFSEVGVNVTATSLVNNANLLTYTASGGSRQSSSGAAIFGAQTNLGGGNLTGYMMEWVLYSKYLSDDDRTNLWNYFQAKWSI